jgi:hypothetical protein
MELKILEIEILKELRIEKMILYLKNEKTVKIEKIVKIEKTTKNNYFLIFYKVW